MTKEEKLARKQQRKAEKVGFGKLLLWNSSSCSVALSTLMLGYATFYCTTTRIMVRFTTDSLIRTWRKRLRIGRCLPICRKRIRAMPTTFGFPSFLTAIL